jgi:hypothetical protein
MDAIGGYPVKRNEMSFAGKWMKPKIVMLDKINQDQKAK